MFVDHYQSNHTYRSKYLRTICGLAFIESIIEISYRSLLLLRINDSNKRNITANNVKFT